MHRCPEIHFTTVFEAQLVHNLFFISHQFEGSCSYKIVLIKEQVYKHYLL